MRRALSVLLLALAAPRGTAVAPPAQTERLVREQVKLCLAADRARKADRPEECRAALLRAIALEPHGGPSHLLAYLGQYLGDVEEALALKAKDYTAREEVRERAGQRVALTLFGVLGRAAARRGPAAVREAEAVTGERHPLLGLVLLDLARQQQAAGDVEAATASLKRAAELTGSVGGPTDGSPWQVRPLLRERLAAAPYQLARRRLQAGKHADAERLLKQAVASSAGRPEKMFFHAAMGELYESWGKLEQARDAWDRVLPLLPVMQRLGASRGTHLELSRYQRHFLDRFLSFARRARLGLVEREVRSTPFDKVPRKVQSDEAVKAYFYLSQYKGNVFAWQRRIRLERQHPTLQPHFEALVQLNRELAAGPRRRAEVLRHIDELEVRLSVLHNRLPKSLNRPPQASLRAGEALVDYFTYDYVPLPGRAKDDRPHARLACFVGLPPGRAIHVDLGELAPVAKAVAAWRRAIQKGGGGHVRGMRPRGEPELEGGELPQATLRERVWKPLAPHLAGVRVVLVAPDGVLARLPFAALPGSKAGTYLLEEMQVVMAPVPQMLVPYRSHTEFLIRRGDVKAALPPRAADAPLLVGGVHFGAGRLEPLPGTDREAAQIAALFARRQTGEKARQLAGKAATKRAVTQAAPGHRYLHLATHGEYRSDLGPDVPADLRASLALSGANLGSAGILTAQEVMFLDLGQVELAVLSACETGLGEAHAGEGVLGLERAFLTAGAKAVVASLWQVDDDATEALMAAFYSNLWEKKLGCGEALRRAQLDMLRGKLERPRRAGQAARGMHEQRLSPFYWAAFALSGDPGRASTR